MKYDFEMDLNPSTSVGKIVTYIKEGSSILEFGPGNGRMTHYLMDKKNCEVSIVELDKELYDHVSNFATDSFYGNIEEYQWTDYYKEKTFDYILFADVLEHLLDPKKTLEIVKKFLKPDGQIVTTFPNVAHNSVLINLFNNKWDYTKYGLLDGTHRTFYTQPSFQRLFKEVGLYIQKEDYTINEVGNNEIDAKYEDLPIEMHNAMRLRPYGEVYQYFFALKSTPVENSEIMVPDNSNYYKPVRLTIENEDGSKTEQTIIVNIYTGENQLYSIEATENVKSITIYPFPENIGGILRFCANVDGKDIENIQTSAVYKNDERYIFTNMQSAYFKLLGDDIAGKTLILNWQYIYQGQFLHEMNQMMESMKEIQSEKAEIIKRYNKLTTDIDKIEFKPTPVQEFNKAVAFNVDSIAYDEDKLVTVITGWGVSNVDKLPLDISVDLQSAPYSKLKRVHRNEINEGFSFPKEIDYGFELTIGDDNSNDFFYLHINLADGQVCHVIINRHVGIYYPPKKSSKVRRVLGAFKRKGIKGSIDWLINRQTKDSLYDHWIEKYENYDVEAIQKEIDNFTYQPKISVVVPVYNVEKKWLDICINSLKNQFYQNWELCLADDASPKPHIKPLLKEYADSDSRIKYVLRDKNGHISEATNSALAIATGDYIGFMDNDDELSPAALYNVVKALNQDQTIDFFYTDEDKITTSGKRFDVFFKSNWNPCLILQHNYITHFVVVKRSLYEQVGGLDSEYNGAQDYDFVLRATEKAENIHHIKGIMYHWRAVETSTAYNPESKNYAYVAGRKALESALRRRNQAGIVQISDYFGCYKTDYVYESTPKISIILHGASKNLAKNIENLLYKTYYGNYELILPENWKSEIKFNSDKIRFISGNLNQRIGKVNSDYIVLLNAKLSPESGTWLDELMNYVQLSSIGIVCGRISNKDNFITNVGLVYDDKKQKINYRERNTPKEHLGYYYRVALPRSIQAASEDCLIVRKSDIEKVGKLNLKLGTQLIGFDLSLKIKEQLNKDIVYTSYAGVKESESIDININSDKMDLLRSDWGESGLFDPFGNPDSM